MLHHHQQFHIQVDKPNRMDSLIAAVMLVTLAPVFLMAALAIKLTSPGSVISAEESIAFGQRRVRLFRFRTRDTAIGAFLRQTSLDELPQLVNVLRGDRSLFGSRRVTQPIPVVFKGTGTTW